ncbi:MAG: STAS domain-containing protein [Nocardiopsaceae bacterium]|mgnify:CR=1 FL=1|nr:STAS domain-containing protein [Nocardiopsaceae bacterium]
MGGGNIAPQSESDSRFRVTSVRIPQGVAFSGECDLSSLREVEDALSAALESEQDVHVDLSGLLFIDAGGLRLLGTTADRLPRSRYLVLYYPPPQVHRMLSLARVDADPNVIVRGAALRG